jgi:TPR repeat protein
MQQVEDFGSGVSVAHDLLDRPLIDTGRFDRLRQDYLRVSDPNSATFDAEAAGRHLAEIFRIADRDQYRWALARYRSAETSVRRTVDGIIDLRSALMRAAEGGDHVAQYELGMFLRAVAEKRVDLEDSTAWLSKSAEAGNPDAMFEYAHAVAFGIGQKADPRLGLIWLDRAQRLHPGRGDELRSLLSAQVSE